jgi:hypothetical protein
MTSFVVTKKLEFVLWIFDLALVVLQTKFLEAFGKALVNEFSLESVLVKSIRN